MSEQKKQIVVTDIHGTTVAILTTDDIPITEVLPK